MLFSLSTELPQSLGTGTRTPTPSAAWAALGPGRLASQGRGFPRAPALRCMVMAEEASLGFRLFLPLFTEQLGLETP